MNLRGYVEKFEQKKSNKSGDVFLIRVEFITADGTRWLSAYTDRQGAPKAFTQRVQAEEGLPTESKTVWDVQVEELTEKGFNNTSVTAAKSVSNGPEPVSLVTPSADDTPVPTAGGRYLGDTPRAVFPSDKDILIVAQVGLKEARATTDTKMAAKPEMTRDDVVASVRSLSLEYAQIIVETARALREGPAKEGPAKDVEWGEEL